MSGYWTHNDPYCWPQTNILRNRLEIRDQSALDEAENGLVNVRAIAGFPNGRFSLTHYRACHRWLFGDVYDWAGNYRTVRLAKSQSVFCFPEHIDSQMRQLFGELKAQNFLRQSCRDAFVKRAAWFWSQLNAIHPFREGNGRTQTLFLANIALAGGWYLDLTRLAPKPTLSAMIASFKTGHGGPLEVLIDGLIHQQELKP
jgi:cell filamentation protein